MAYTIDGLAKTMANSVSSVDDYIFNVLININFNEILDLLDVINSSPNHAMISFESSKIIISKYYELKSQDTYEDIDYPFIFYIIANNNIDKDLAINIIKNEKEIIVRFFDDYKNLAFFENEFPFNGNINADLLDTIIPIYLDAYLYNQYGFKNEVISKIFEFNNPSVSIKIFEILNFYFKDLIDNNSSLNLTLIKYFYNFTSQCFKKCIVNHIRNDKININFINSVLSENNLKIFLEVKNIYFKKLNLNDYDELKNQLSIINYCEILIKKDSQLGEVFKKIIINAIINSCNGVDYDLNNKPFEHLFKNHSISKIKLIDLSPLNFKEINEIYEFLILNKNYISNPLIPIFYELLNETINSEISIYLKELIRSQIIDFISNEETNNLIQAVNNEFKFHEGQVEISQVYNQYNKFIHSMILGKDDNANDENLDIDNIIDNIKYQLYFNNDAFDFTEDSGYGFHCREIKFNDNTPIGYNIHMPADVDLKGIMINVYGGGNVYGQEKFFNYPGDISTTHWLLLNEGYAIITLNLIDILQSENHQMFMTENIHLRLHQSINFFKEIIVNTPEIIHQDLKNLKDQKCFLSGQSFGGRTAVRHGELFPKSFDGLIAFSPALDIVQHFQNLHGYVNFSFFDDKVDKEYRDVDSLSDKLVSANWLCPMKHLNDLEDRLIIIHNKDDHRVLVKSTCAFFKKACAENKVDYIELNLREKGSSLDISIQDLTTKGHFENTDINYLQYNLKQIINFMNNSSSNSKVISIWRAHDNDILSSRYNNKTTINDYAMARFLEFIILNEKKYSNREEHFFDTNLIINSNSSRLILEHSELKKIFDSTFISFYLCEEENKNFLKNIFFKMLNEGYLNEQAIENFINIESLQIKSFIQEISNYSKEEIDDLLKGNQYLHDSALNLILNLNVNPNIEFYIYIKNIIYSLTHANSHLRNEILNIIKVNENINKNYMSLVSEISTNLREMVLERKNLIKAVFRDAVKNINTSPAFGRYLKKNNIVESFDSSERDKNKTHRNPKK